MGYDISNESFSRLGVLVASSTTLLLVIFISMITHKKASQIVHSNSSYLKLLLMVVTFTVVGLLLLSLFPTTIFAQSNNSPTAVTSPYYIYNSKVIDIGGYVPMKLRGQDSYDSDGSIISYVWTYQGEVIASGQQVTVFIKKIVGMHTFTLTVTDNDGATGTKDVKMSVSGTLCTSVSRPGLQLGDVDASGKVAVKNAQIGLTRLGYYTGDISGTFDTATETAVKALQNNSGITENGRIGSTENVLIFNNCINEEPYLVDEVIYGPQPATIVEIDTGANLSNNIPIANAGVFDYSIGDPDNNNSEVVHLDGTLSSDSDGTIVEYLWHAKGEVLSTEATPDITLPLGNHYIFLTVTDNEGGKDTFWKIVRVLDEYYPNNIPPVANAGPDITVTYDPDASSPVVPLDGTLSYDPDGKIAFYRWKIRDTYIATGANTSRWFNKGTTTKVTLEVVDNQGAISTDDINITTVEGAVGCCGSGGSSNVPPVANGGPDVTIEDADDNGWEFVHLDGSGSTDSDGSIAGYQWRKGALVFNSGALFNFAFVVGTHTLTLTVTDNQGSQNTDTVTVVITPSGSGIGCTSPVFRPTLQRGDSDGLGETAVRDLQSALLAKGYSPGSIDGVFGLGTKAAVTSLQTAHGLTIDGIAGSQVNEVLFGECGDDTPPDPNEEDIPTNPAGMYTQVQVDGVIAGMPNTHKQLLCEFLPTQTIVQGAQGFGPGWLQTILNDVYGANLTIDGNFGSLSRTSLSAFQQIQGIPVTGIWDSTSRSKVSLDLSC
jgi:peptidoglycan hydrolase-like protein with peptidoglycan-binding domain